MKRFKLGLSVSQWTALAILASSAALSFAVTLPHTFVSGNPAVAEQVNQNFDALNGAIEARTGPASVSVSQAAFADREESDITGCAYFRRGDGGRYEGTNDQCTAVAPISLPQGATVTGLHCTVWDNVPETNRNISLSLRRADLTSGLGLESVVFQTGFSTETANTQVLSDTMPEAGTAIVNNENFAYHLEARFWASGSSVGAVILRLYGCRVSYTW